MNTNEQTIHQMGLGISSLVKQATGRESVSNIDMDWVSVEQLARYIYGSGSGDVVTFDTNIPDAIESLIAYITAVQDLHGYDNPWPAGGGKNLYSNIITTETVGSFVSFTANEDGTLKILGSTSPIGANAKAKLPYEIPSGTSTIIRLFNTVIESDVGVRLIRDVPGENKQYGNTVFADAVDKNAVVSEVFNATHIQVIVNDNHIDINMVLKILFEIGADSSSAEWSPYSNICPITGWTGCNVTRTGKNLYDSATKTNGYYISSNGTITESSSYSYSALIPVEEGKKYIFKGNNSRPASDSKRMHGYDSSGNWVQQIGYVTASASSDFSLTATIPTGVKYVRISFRTADTNISVVNADIFSVTWQTEAGTVYGGMLDVLSGVLTVDWAGTTVNNCSWEYDSEYTRFKTTLIGIRRYSSQRVTPLYCSAFVVIDDGREINTVPDNAIYGGGTNNSVYIKNTTYTDANQFKTAFADVQIVYPLTTPVTYQLTAQEVTALVGQNTIYADTGNVSVQYKVKEDLV